MMVTFRSFRTAINQLVFPDGQAETRVPLFRNFLVNGLIQAQTYVESYQLVNVNFYDKDQSHDDCGTSVIQVCRGMIGAVYAFKPSCRCTRFFYTPASLEKLSCLYDQCRCAASTTCCSPLTSMNVSAYTRNPLYCGDYVDGNAGCRPPYLTLEPEDDCQFKLSERFFAIGPNQKLWVYPRFPCGYLLAVHWRGIKRSYLDADYVMDDDDLKDLIACYVEQQIAKRVDNDQVKAAQLLVDHRLKIGDIIYREENDLKPRAGRVCVEGLDQSELVQIYPSNLYPYEVGQSCAGQSNGDLSVQAYSCPAATGSPTDLGGPGNLPDDPPTIPSRLRIVNFNGFAALLNATCAECVDASTLGGNAIAWDGTFPSLERDDSIAEYRWRSHDPLAPGDIFGNLVFGGKRLGTCVVRYAYGNGDPNAFIVEILCAKTVPPAFIVMEVVWTGILYLGQTGAGTYTRITDPDSVGFGTELGCASTPDCLVLEAY